MFAAAFLHHINNNNMFSETFLNLSEIWIGSVDKNNNTTVSGINASRASLWGFTRKDIYM